MKSRKHLMKPIQAKAAQGWIQQLFSDEKESAV